MRIIFVYYRDFALRQCLGFKSTLIFAAEVNGLLCALVKTTLRFQGVRRLNVVTALSLGTWTPMSLLTQ